MNIGELIKNYRVNRKIRKIKRKVARFNASIELDETPSYDPVKEAREREELENRFKDYLDKKCDYGLIK